MYVDGTAATSATATKQNTGKYYSKEAAQAIDTQVKRFRTEKHFILLL